ncbi:MAG: hypothetical protein WD934_09665 [Gemmatimonadales bacterium]
MRTNICETAGLMAARALTMTVALAALLLPEAAVAQRVTHQVNQLLNADGTPGLDLRAVRPNGFHLYAAGDAALTGMRMTGNHGASFSNYADCTNVLYSCQNQRMVRAAGGTVALWFYNSWIVGAPPSQWRKIREIAPSVNNATGGGFTAGFNEELTGGFVRFGPADLTLGQLFAGATSTSDGTCRDNTGFGNASVPAGIPLLSQSICTDTWSSAGWQGGQKITGEGWEGHLADVGAASFTWDFWRVDDANQTPGFFGNLIQAYGETTDFYENIRNAFGSVLPGGTGNPALQGYPLGIKIRFDVFNFAVPSVNAVKFVRALVINRSEDVWGTGIDYDSLYFGISPGDLGSSQVGTAWYNLPAIGGIVRVVAGANTAANPCNEPFREPVFACAPSAGWALGSQAIVILKSPIGDLRNKLFTRTASGTPCTVGTDPFCNPAHPLAGDTFTYNQSRMCGFGACNTFVWAGGFAGRSGFGHLSGNEVNTLAGRDVNAIAAAQAWSTFRSHLWPDRAHYTKWQPNPAWDYNKDGVPDTLSVNTCHLVGCVGLASDTFPGGFVNLSSNVGGLHAAGPFSLGAGDTTSFWYAVLGERDSVSTMTQVAAALDLYLNFFLAPEAPPAAEVVSTQIRAATDALGSINPEVQIFFSDAPQRWIDPFLTKLAADILAAPAGTPLANLAALNGGNAALSALVAARASDNLERIEVYKSCDGGATFTGTGSCVGNPTTNEDGVSQGLGWRAYRIFSADAAAGIPSSFADGSVDGGRSYLYVIIGKSRGANFLLNTATGPGEVEFAPSIRNVLSRSTSEPNVVSIYVPASRNAGFVPATATMTSRPVEGTVPITLTFAESVTPGTYTATFGNRILVARDSLISTATAVRTVVTTERRVTADVAGVATPTTVFSNTATRAGADVFPFAGTPAATASATIVDTVRVTDTYNAIGFTVARAGAAFFGSITLTGVAATPSSLFGLADYPGFVISANNSVAGGFNSGTERHIRGAVARERLRLAAADTITPRGVVNGFMPQWQEGVLSVRTAFGGGVYEVRWTAEPYGSPNGGFIMNRTNPAATQAEVAAALAGRTVGQTGLDDAPTSALTGIPQTDLVPVRLPFTMHNLTYDRPVSVAMARRLSNRILLGASTDTMSILVPEDEWIPGDALVLMENVEQDSVTGVGTVLSGAGQPIRVTQPRVTFTSAVVGCQTAVRLTCNPIPSGSPGATGYNPILEGDRTQSEYYVGFAPGTQFVLDVTAPIAGEDITSVTDSALATIRVVPNPFVIFSQYQGTSASNSQVLFTNLPPTGTLRIYTVAGQFVQQITFTPDDLAGAGDLFFNLRTREGIDMASGLYFWVLNAPSDPTNPTSTPLRAAGKFVIIRGSAQ